MNETLTNFKPNADLQDRLKKDHALLFENVEDLAKRASELPENIESDEQQNEVSDFVKEARQVGKRVEAIRVAEKAVFLDGERKVDGLFNGVLERVKNMDSRLNARILRYLNRKAELERIAREQEAERLRQEERQRLAEAEAAQREEEEAAARLAQLQAPDPSEPPAEGELPLQQPRPTNFDIMQAADDKAEAKGRADAAIGEAIDIGNRAAEVQASIDSAKPADLARTRSEAGSLATLARVWKFEVVDFDKIDLNLLKPYFTNADIEKALRGFVKKHKGSLAVEGVRIYEQNQASVR